MNTKAKYYEIFGLTEKATKQEVRRAYRKLAMRFHPDKNPDPKAHKLFIDLTEAYQILLEDRPLPKQENSAARKKEKTEEQRIREAQLRLKKQHYRNYLEQEYYFRKLTSGRRWLIFKAFTWVSGIIAFVLLVEPVLPSHFENHVITSYSTLYNGLEHTNVRCLKTDQELKIFTENPNANMLFTDPEVIVERSWVLHNPVRVWYRTPFYRRSYPVDFSIINLYPSVPFLLLIPAITFWYRRKSYMFSIGYFFSQYIVGAFLVYIVFTQDRWAHLLTLGFL